MLTFAVNKTSGDLVGIDQIGADSWGTRCGCRCPNDECKESLVAKTRDFPGRKKAKHFAHESDTECAGAVESALHLLAKKIVADEGFVMAPALEIVPVPPNWKTPAIFPTEKLDFDQIIVERVIEGLKPDLIGIRNNVRYMLEIRCTHEVDERKREHARLNNWNLLEFDLSELVKQDLFTEQEVRDRLLHGKGTTIWINHADRSRLQKRLDSCTDELLRSTKPACPGGLGSVPNHLAGEIQNLPLTQEAPCKVCPCFIGITDDAIRCSGAIGIDSIEALKREGLGLSPGEPDFIRVRREHIEDKAMRRVEQEEQRVAAQKEYEAELARRRAARGLFDKKGTFLSGTPPFRPTFEIIKKPAPIGKDAFGAAMTRLTSLILRYHKNEDGRPPLAYTIYVLAHPPVGSGVMQCHGVFHVGADIFWEVAATNLRPTPFEAIGFFFIVDGWAIVVLDPPEGRGARHHLCLN